MQESGFDLGALIDNLLQRREQRVIDAEKDLVASGANEGAKLPIPETYK